MSSTIATGEFTYTAVEWKDGQTLLNSTNLNVSETGLKNLASYLNEKLIVNLNNKFDSIDTAQANQTTLNDAQEKINSDQQTVNAAQAAKNTELTNNIAAVSSVVQNNQAAQDSKNNEFSSKINKLGEDLQTAVTNSVKLSQTIKLVCGNSEF